jgi:hypothetical protein
MCQRGLRFSKISDTLSCLSCYWLSKIGPKFGPNHFQTTSVVVIKGWPDDFTVSFPNAYASQSLFLAELLGPIFSHHLRPATRTGQQLTCIPRTCQSFAKILCCLGWDERNCSYTHAMKSN